MARDKKTASKTNQKKQAAEDQPSREKSRSRPGAPVFVRAGRTKSPSKPARAKSATAAVADESPARAGDAIVTVDRRVGERRSGQDRRQKQIPVAVERRKLERRAKVPRRRQIDPTTCERDYSADEIEFMRALEAYKRSSGRMFPTCSEILEVLRNLGYEKRPMPSHAEPAKTDEPENSAAVGG
ncbi:MAG: hypothetical protein Kow0040_13340 [Thermogutta sp.]